MPALLSSFLGDSDHGVFSVLVGDHLYTCPTRDVRPTLGGVYSTAAVVSCHGQSVTGATGVGDISPTECHRCQFRIVMVRVVVLVVNINVPMYTPSPRRCSDLVVFVDVDSPVSVRMDRSYFTMDAGTCQST